jgi:hypothetical protein
MNDQLDTFLVDEMQKNVDETLIILTMVNFNFFTFQNCQEDPRLGNNISVFVS